MPPHLARVLGPYRNGQRWRLVVFDGVQRKAMLADSREEAEKIKAGLLRMFEDRSGITIGAALDEYLAEKRKAGLKESSVLAMDPKLRLFLPIASMLREITPQRAARCICMRPSALDATVCPHSLRGLHASLAVTRGASSRFVAEALDHGSENNSKRHYITPDAMKSASDKRVAAALSQKTDDVRELDSLAERLRSLARAQLAALL